MSNNLNTKDRKLPVRITVEILWAYLAAGVDLFQDSHIVCTFCDGVWGEAQPQTPTQFDAFEANFVQSE